MMLPKKRCACCHDWFPPDPRVPARKFCARSVCRRQSRLQTHRRWWRNNGTELDAARTFKRKAWAKNTAYWRNYRADNPDYVRRDNERRRQSRQKAARAANQDMRRQISVGKLRDILSLRPETAANQDMIHRRVEGLENFLLWKEGAANQEPIAPAATVLAS
jgi:hypothetical protein